MTKIYTTQKLFQLTKVFKNNAVKTKEKTQEISAKIQATYDVSGQESKSLKENIASMQVLKTLLALIEDNYLDGISFATSILQDPHFITKEINKL